MGSVKDVETSTGMWHPVPDVCGILYSNVQSLSENLRDVTVTSSQHDILLRSETVLSDMSHMEQLLIPGSGRLVLLCWAGYLEPNG